MDFDSQEFIKNQTYNSDDLGCTVNNDGTCTFKLWAPTASDVKLNLYSDGTSDSLIKTVNLRKLKKGVWYSRTGCSDLTYYTYSIVTDEGLQEAIDPYAKACTVNGKRAMAINLKNTDPKGFEKDRFVKCDSLEDAIIWEVHVRDFSNRIVSSKFKGKYTAFTELNLKNSNGLKVGIDYLKELGITHVQLQPVFDYGSGDEANTDSWFNWGYDPANYNVPEGSYSSDPYNGKVRIFEFKQMIQALHKAKIGVVMDVVYNHTFFVNSNLWKTVPYYYYRYKGWQQLSNGSGCGNETASERYMFRKYMLDSILYWQKEYHIDGFRFDLMALHDVKTMTEIDKEIHKVNKYALLYGEPWSGGESALPYNLRAIPENLPGNTRIATFNDSLRDALKGNCFNVNDRGYINLNPNFDNTEKIAHGICAKLSINYMSCHDNFTLFDKLNISCPDSSNEEKLAMNMFGFQILTICHGTPFMLAGEEMLRTKNGDGNSYMSSDSVNNIDWNCLYKNSDSLKTSRYYSKLIKIRKANPFIHNSVIKCSVLGSNIIKVRYIIGRKTVGMAFVNPNPDTFSARIPAGNWYVIFNGKSTKRTELKSIATVNPLSVILIKREDFLHVQE